jgi:hypothetical protein
MKALKFAILIVSLATSVTFAEQPTLNGALQDLKAARKHVEKAAHGDPQEKARAIRNIDKAVSSVLTAQKPK